MHMKYSTGQGGKPLPLYNELKSPSLRKPDLEEGYISCKGGLSIAGLFSHTQLLGSQNCTVSTYRLL